jgi:hypothetical protein
MKMWIAVVLGIIARENIKISGKGSLGQPFSNGGVSIPRNV